MARLELVRNTTGELTATADGNPIAGAYVKDIERYSDWGLTAVVLVPLKHAIVKEIDNVVPLLRPVR